MPDAHVPTTLTQTDVDGVAVLQIAGPLTQDGGAAVAAAFEAATPGDGRVVVDLSAVPVMTTPGITLLVAAAGRARNGGGRVVLAGMTAPVEEVLRRCRLDTVLPIAGDVGDAVRAARA